MASQASHVLLRPFREVVKWASLAAVNAQDASNAPGKGLQLQGASSRLLRDAERAIKRLAAYLEYPSPQLNVFLTELVVRNDVIAEYRAIDDLLYNFEDYIGVDSFDQTEFTALSAAIKSLALLLLERIQRFTVESSLDVPPPPSKEPGPFRPLPALPERANISAERVTQQPADLRLRRGSKFAPTPAGTEVKPEAVTSSTTGNFVGLGRTEHGSPITLSSGTRPGSAASMRTSATHASSKQQQLPQHSPPPPSRRDYPRLVSLSQHDQIHEKEPTSFDSYPPLPDHRSICASPEVSITKSDSYRPSHLGRTSSTASCWPQLGDHDHHQQVLPIGGLAASRQSFALSSQLSPTNRDSTFDHNSSFSSGATSHSSRRGSVAGNNGGGVRNGCHIGSDSSLSSLGGFCKGARAFAATGPGQAIKKVGETRNSQAQKPQDFSQGMAFGAMLAVETTSFTEPMAQCISCDYQTIYSQLLQDMDSDPLAKQQARGITYRSRFLYKSHIAVKDYDRVFFACVFCDKTKSTCHEGDATVFQSVDLLIRHIARHPLPLPPVASVTVLYHEPGGPAPIQQDYDLILPDTQQPQPPGPPAGALAFIASLPTARANKDNIRRRNSKPQDRPDNSCEVLQFLANARILGVEYPDKWDGKWCQGWHDGVRGVFLSKIIQLDAPDNVAAIIKSVPRSLRTGVTKWDWDCKTRTGASNWLTFSKGSKITGLAWDDPYAWYWIGTNSKGRLGIFPKTHIRIETIQDGSIEQAQKGDKSSRKSWLFGRRG